MPGSYGGCRGTSRMPRWFRACRACPVGFGHVVHAPGGVGGVVHAPGGVGGVVHAPWVSGESCMPRGCRACHAYSVASGMSCMPRGVGHVVHARWCRRVVYARGCRG